MTERALNHQQVMEILPHRDPMLLIDEVVALEPMQRIEAKLSIRPEWDIFKGHFPGNPIFPVCCPWSAWHRPRIFSS